MASAVDLGEPRTPAGGPHVRDKQDVGERLALAFREQFIPGDGPFYTPGAIAATATTIALTAQSAGQINDNGSSSEIEITLQNLPPGDSPMLAPWSALGLEVSNSPPASRITGNDSWVNATTVSLGKARGTLRVKAALAGATQVRYLWADNACMGWNSTTQRRETGQWRCPLYTTAGLPVLPFLLDVHPSAETGSKA